jgi:hypothetical protein
MTTKFIASPVGGFGNHLRWLLLLDQQFTITIDNFNLIEKYNALKGADWPDAVNTIANKDVSDAIKAEIKAKFGDFLTFGAHRSTYSTETDKVDFIRYYVYNDNRSWHNWLAQEQTFRQQLDQHIVFDHHYQNANADSLHIVTTINPNIAYKSYLKFNSNLNNLTKQEFLTQIADWNIAISDIANRNKNVLQLDGNLLYDNVLNKELYTTAIEWFNLTDHYELANKLHNVWFELHKKAEREIVQELNALYGDE